MRGATLLGIGTIILAATTVPIPADAVPPPGYCLSISDVEPPVVHVATCTYESDPRTVVSVARIHQGMGATQRRVMSKVSLCRSGDDNPGRFKIARIGSSTDFRVEYTRASDGADITRAVSDGTYRTGVIKLGCVTYRMDVIRVRKASVGTPRTFGLSADPEGPGWKTTKAATHVTAATFTG
jgi:hypothetical protein